VIWSARIYPRFHCAIYRAASLLVNNICVKSWPHAPSKQVDGPGRYIVTSATYRKQHVFVKPADLDLFQEHLFATALEFEFELQAWAVFSNHYHFVGFTKRDGVRDLTKSLHGRTSLVINKRHGSLGRQV
jgi:putative transposase